MLKEEELANIFRLSRRTHRQSGWSAPDAGSSFVSPQPAPAVVAESVRKLSFAERMLAAAGAGEARPALPPAPAGRGGCLDGQNAGRNDGGCRSDSCQA